MLKHKKLHNAIVIQIGEAKTNAKTNIGNIPFKPAVTILSNGNLIAIDVKIQATNIEARLVIIDIKIIVPLAGFCFLLNVKKENE